MEPEFLNKNDTIMLVAPSFGCTISPYKERLSASIANFKRLKYNIIEGDNIRKDLGKAASNTPKLRAKEIMDAFNSNAKAIMSVGGGETMIEILPYLDFEVIKANPKWYLGYSDNTILTFTLATLCDMESIYGINFPSFHTLPFKYDCRDTLKMLEGNNTFLGYKSFERHEYVPLEEGEEPKEIDPLEPRHVNKRTKLITYSYTTPVEGRLIGGCLDVLQCLCGTEYDKACEYAQAHKDEGLIYFLEACELNSVAIRRALFQLKSAGWFKNVKMFIIGRSYNLNDKSFGIDIRDSYIDMLKEYNVPIILDAPFGHIGPTLPIRSNAHARVSIENNQIKFEY